MSRLQPSPWERSVLEWPCLGCGAPGGTWCRVGLSRISAKPAAASAAGTPAGFLHSIRISTAQIASSGVGHISPQHRRLVADYMSGAAIEPVWLGRCMACDEPIGWYGRPPNGGAWAHLPGPRRKDHQPEPELRAVIDATCPGCAYPEIGYAPARQVFTCSRCGHEQTERPAA